MLKLAVVGAQTLLGRELVEVLEAREASVVPLATGALTPEQEEQGEIVVFAPEPALLEGLDAVILADTPQDVLLLEHFPGRILDLRREPDQALEPMPLAGAWPEGVKSLRGRPATDQVLAALPRLMSGFTEVAGTHLRSVAWLGDEGLDALAEQTVAVLNGEEPDTDRLGWRAAFEVVPQVARGRFLEVRVPAFHGDLLVLHLKGEDLAALEAPEGCAWVDQPPTNRDVAVSADLLAHWSGNGEAGVLTLGFDPVLWGTLRPALRLFGM